MGNTKGKLMKKLYIHTGRNWHIALKLPNGKGLNFGPGMTGYWSVRTWDWTQYDFADHSRNHDHLMEGM